MSAFARHIGIDYSGAQTPTASLKGLRVYLAEGSAIPVEVAPPPSSRKYWTRRGVAEWLVERLTEDASTLVGIDHGFSFPLRYFEVHGLAPDWPAFLDDFQRHWPTDEDHMNVDFVRDGSAGDGASRMGSSRWRRLTEERAGGAKSVFHFDVPGQVATSTHCGDPLVALRAPTDGGPRSLLALRRVGRSGRPIRHRRGLSRAVESPLRPRWANIGSARCLFRRRLALPRRS